MAVNLLQWFITKMAAYTGGGLSREGITELFYRPEDRAAVHIAFQNNNNGKTLFTRGSRASSGWQSYTVPAAQAVRQDAAAIAERLAESCPDGFFSNLTAFRQELENDRSEVTLCGYNDSRLRVWVNALSSTPLQKLTAARIAAMVFAEIVFYMEEETLRMGGGMVVAQLAEQAFAPKAFAAEPLPELPEQSGMVNNLYMRSRTELEKLVHIREMLEGASEICMFNITAIGLIYGHENEEIDYKRGIFEECLYRGVRFRVVLPKPGSIGERDAGTYKLKSGYGGDQNRGIDMIRHTRETLKKDIERMEADGRVNQVLLRYQDCAVPYALMLVTFEDAPERDHVKVDLLGPYLENDLDRRSFYVYRSEDPENYQFFYRHFETIYRQSIPYKRFDGMMPEQQEKNEQ